MNRKTKGRSEFTRGCHSHPNNTILLRKKMSSAPGKINSLSDLNDDCIHEILCLLSIEGLARMASTNTRMQSLARNVFNLKHKSKCLDLYEFASYNPYGWSADVNFIDDKFHNGRLLQHFGDMATDISLAFTSNQTETFNFVIKYCSAGALDKLTIIGRSDHFKTDKSLDIIRLFGSIKELQLYDCNQKAFNGKQLSKCNRLEKLTLYKTEAGKFLLHNFPNIKSFAMQRVCDEDRRKTILRLNDFIKRHQQLIDLEFNSPEYCNLTIVGQLPHLERLSINAGLFSFGDENIMPLATLNKLKSLKLYCGDLQMGKFLNCLQLTESLEELDLIYCCFPYQSEFMAAIAKFHRLEILKFNGGCWLKDDHLAHLNLQHLRKLSIMNLFDVTDNGLINLVNKWPTLEELTLNLSMEKFHLSSKVYTRIADICENRKSRLVLMVNCGVDMEFKATLCYQREEFLHYYDNLETGDEDADEGNVDYRERVDNNVI